MSVYDHFRPDQTSGDAGSPGLRSHKSYKAGDVIFSVKHEVHSLDPKLKGKYCDNCYTKSDKLKRCAGCKSLAYCSRSCQKEDWIAFHKHKECDFYQKLCTHEDEQLKQAFRDIRPGNCAFLIRALLLIKAKPSVVKVEHTLFNGDKKTWLGLMDNDGLNEKYDPWFRTTVSRLKAIDPLLFTDCPALCPVFTSLYHMVRINTHVINHRTEVFPDGQGLSVPVSCLNHSCRPNVSAVFKGNRVEFRAVKDIAVGDEVTFSYIELCHPKAHRHREIRNMWEFVCNCERCAAGDQEGEVEDLDKVNQMNEYVATLPMLTQVKEYLTCLSKVVHLREKYEGPYHFTLTDDMCRAVEARLRLPEKLSQEETALMQQMMDKLMKAVPITHGQDHEMYTKVVSLNDAMRCRISFAAK